MEHVNRVLLVEHRVRDGEEPHVRGLAEGVVEVLGLNVCLKALPARVYLTNGLLQTLLERTTNSHDFTNGLHGGTDLPVYRRELRQVPLGNLRNDVVQGRFKACRGGFRNRVRELRERVTESNLRSRICERITSCLRRKRTVRR